MKAYMFYTFLSGLFLVGTLVHAQYGVPPANQQAPQLKKGSKVLIKINDGVTTTNTWSQSAPNPIPAVSMDFFDLFLVVKCLFFSNLSL